MPGQAPPTSVPGQAPPTSVSRQAPPTSVPGQALRYPIRQCHHNQLTSPMECKMAPGHLGRQPERLVQFQFPPAGPVAVFTAAASVRRRRD